MRRHCSGKGRAASGSWQEGRSWAKTRSVNPEKMAMATSLAFCLRLLVPGSMVTSTPHAHTGHSVTYRALGFWQVALQGFLQSSPLPGNLDVNLASPLLPLLFEGVPVSFCSYPIMLLAIAFPGGHDGWEREGNTEFKRCLGSRLGLEAEVQALLQCLADCLCGWKESWL